MQREDWAAKWCELNDCHGVQEAEQRSAAAEKYEREVRKAARRYATTGKPHRIVLRIRRGMQISDIAYKTSRRGQSDPN